MTDLAEFADHLRREVAVNFQIPERMLREPKLTTEAMKHDMLTFVRYVLAPMEIAVARLRGRRKSRGWRRHVRRQKAEARRR